MSARGAFTRGVNVLHGIPFLLGGTLNTPAIRTLAKIEHWICTLSHGTDEISPACNSFATSLHTAKNLSTHEQIIRLPASLTSTERLPFIVTRFDNLKTAVKPMSKEDEKSLKKLNSLFPVHLSIEIVCDRFMENKNNVFEDETMGCTDLVLIDASHMSKVRRHLDLEACLARASKLLPRLLKQWSPRLPP